MKTRSKALHFLVFFLIICQVACVVLWLSTWATMMATMFLGGEPKEPPLFFPLFFIVFFLVMLVLFPLSILFYVLMIVDAVKRPFADDSQRTLWIVLVAVSIMLWLVPAYVYYFIHGRKPRELPELEPTEGR
jgi:hypothetical protein